MSEQKISITVHQLEKLLDDQKRVTGDYLTRNLSVYGDGWENFPKDMRDRLKSECYKSPHANDFEVLKKYLS